MIVTKNEERKIGRGQGKIKSPTLRDVLRRVGKVN